MFPALLQSGFPFLLISFLVVPMILLIQCSKKKKGVQGAGVNQTVVKGKRPPPNVREDMPRKEGVAAVKDYQTLGKTIKQKTVSKTSAISKEKTSIKKEKEDDKTKAGDNKKDSNEDKKDNKVDKQSEIAKNDVKTAIVKSSIVISVAEVKDNKDNAKTDDKKEKADDKKEKANNDDKSNVPAVEEDKGGENYEQLDNIENPK